jgi:hypothetical protein
MSLRIRHLLLATLVMVLGAGACQSPLSPSEHRLLAAAEQRWAARGFSDYSIESSTSCFCPPEMTGWTRIEVVDGQVRKATLLETGEVVTDIRLNYWSSVESLFATIRNSSRDDWIADLEVAFDPILGFPTVVGWVPEDGIVDGGATRTLRNAQPLP